MPDKAASRRVVAAQSRYWLRAIGWALAHPFAPREALRAAIMRIAQEEIDRYERA